ncbi:hypothetical protein QVD17_16862 [Tagetes erecta]|uniref:Uncharacterized protein n=1 Tax=Tagetes erecta TaxID=13708 RepID=A0AAD8KYF8_TARER|nr:hypothetical protein QVD17_16862 [Tagetes erecta]
MLFSLLSLLPPLSSSPPSHQPLLCRLTLRPSLLSLLLCRFNSTDGCCLLDFKLQRFEKCRCLWFLTWWSLSLRYLISLLEDENSATYVDGASELLICSNCLTVK